MGDDELEVCGPIEMPLRRVRPITARHRHRPLLGTAGLLLFMCLFLPAVDGCHAPIVPLDAPPFWPPYLYGLVFALVALARSERGLVGAAMVLRVLAWLVMVGGVAMLALVPYAGMIELGVGLALLATMGWSGASEPRLALTALVIGVVGVAWFALWCLTGDALIGVYLSLASAGGLVAGSLVWLHDLAMLPATQVPEAIARPRG